MTHDHALILWTIGLVELVHLFAALMVALWFFARGGAFVLTVYEPGDPQ